jgi:hypothetical protein
MTRSIGLPPVRHLSAIDRKAIAAELARLNEERDAVDRQ